MPYSTEKLANLRQFHKEIRSPRSDGSTSNAPLLLAIHATSRCNFRCVHCSRVLSDEVPAEMSLELFLQLVPLVKTAHELYLFGDGEVLLNIPQHLAMIARVHQEDPDCALWFSTNGKLLAPAVYELYATAGIQYIQFSIDAATKELYEAIRRGGNFDELIANLEGIAALRSRAKARHPQLRLATVISQQNYRDLPQVAELARRYGFCYWYINAEYPHSPGREGLRLTADDRAEIERIREQIIQNYSAAFLTVFDPSVVRQAD